MNTNYRRIKSQENTASAHAFFKILEYINQIIIFSILGSNLSTHRFYPMIYNQGLTAIRTIFMPVAAALNLIESILAWRQAALHQYEASFTSKAVVETITAATLIATSVAAIVFASVFGFIGPLVYSGVLIAKAIYDTGSAIHLSYKSRHEVDSDKADEYRGRAAEATAQAIFGGLAGIGLGLMVFLPAPVFEIVGLAIGLMATIMGVVSALIISSVHAKKANNAAALADIEGPSDRMNSVTLAKQFRSEPGHTVTPVVAADETATTKASSRHLDHHATIYQELVSSAPAVESMQLTR